MGQQGRPLPQPTRESLSIHPYVRAVRICLRALPSSPPSSQVREGCVIWPTRCPTNPLTHPLTHPPKKKETYEYYDLPFCKPVGGVETRQRGHSLGEQLEGHELVNSGLKLRCVRVLGLGRFGGMG